MLFAFTLTSSSVLSTIVSIIGQRLRQSIILRLACLAMLGICALPELAHAQRTGRPPTPTTDAGMLIDSGMIVAVRFEGNENLTDYELSQVIATRVSKGFAKFINSIIPSLGTPPQYADRVVLDQDVDNLENFYRDNGFMEADVEYEQRFDSTDYRHYIEVLNRNRVTTRENRQQLPRVRDTIVFWISEGPAYTIAGVAFIGLESLPEEFQPELTERNTIKIGERWSAATANAEIARLQHVLEENGYPFFKRDTIIAEVLPETERVRVLPYLNPGNRYRFGNVRIEWDTTSREDSRVSDRVVLGQLSMDSGAWYKESEVRESEQYLNRLNVFESVKVFMDTTGVVNIPQHLRDSMALPMVVRLRMRVTQEVTPSAYVGFGGELGFAGGGSVGYVNRNLFGGAQRFDFDAFLQALPATQPRRSLTASMLIPYMGWRNVPLNISASYIDTKQFTADELSTTNYVEVIYRLRLNSTIVIGDPINRSSLSPEITGEYVDKKDSNEITKLYNITQQVNLIFGASSVWDRANDAINPTAGYILNAGGEFAVPWLANFAPSDKFSSASYWKGVLQGRAYDDLGTIGALILATKLRAGYTRLFDPGDPRRDPPLNRRFYSGGSSSNRGWNSQQLLISNIPLRNPNEGGYYLIESTVEFRLAPWRFDVSSDDPATFLNPLRIAVFADAGNVWDQTTFKQVGINQIAFTTGVGLRYDFVLGTLRVDFGIKTYDPNPDYNAKFHPIAARADTRGRWITERNLWDNSEWWNIHFGLNQPF